jgi:hypothetical protein
LPQVASAPLRAPAADERAHGGLVEMDGQSFYRIDDVDRMAPFLTTVASDSDHWLFASSTGGLTAGRRSPDHALFPYTTDDRLHEAGEHAGPKTVIRVRRPDGVVALWEPWSSRYEGLYRISRALSKSLVGNQLIFEETNHDLQLRFSYAWMPSDSFGFVRRVRIANLDDAICTIDIADGLQNVLPAGLGRRFQMEYSTLGDGYKDSELDPETGLGIFRLSSIPIDAPEPSEALRATTVWSHGLPAPRYFLSSAGLDAFRRGQPLSLGSASRLRGRRGNYFVTSTLTLAPGAVCQFHVVANLEQDSSDVVATLQRLRAGGDLAALIESDCDRATANLTGIVAAADGLQAGGDALASARHFANVMFNCMRGGIPAQGYQITRDDLADFVRAANRPLFERHADFFAKLPGVATHASVLAAARGAGDSDLERLAHEYLPFTFSRRHGDPSRPWNIFAIAVKDAAGNRRLDYQGNWRDIFQNWEALARSFPGFAISMIFKFVDSSTADGHNPYRIMRDGFDWEVHDPHDPWSHIGYWGDHQVIYLQRLLEVATAHDPAALPGLLNRRVFSHANVPYRIKPYRQLVRDPHATIVFDTEAHRAALARVAALGGDGRLLADARGHVVLVSLAEKLLVMALAKLANFIPGVGIWMNTQRPEWNDANNALVGNGASMVTVYHLRRFLAQARGLFNSAPTPGFTLSVEVAQLLEGTCRALERQPATVNGDRQRRSFLDTVAQPYDDYRAALYARGLSDDTRLVAVQDVQRLIDAALGHVDRAIAANRRADGLYHAYNLIKITDDGIGVRRLDVMLEGQVAVLGAGVLSAAEALEVLQALRRSPLFRADQGSYLLYPDKELPVFLAKNLIAAADVAACPLITRLLEANHRGIVARDVAGQVHFDADLKNARFLNAALDQLAVDAPQLAASAGERQLLLDLYERVFDHHAFTGRSGSLYKYEGLGCIYWHMVSKLRLAVHEILQRALRGGADADVIAGLRGHHAEICAGLGVHKSPAAYGAFTTDPYSHTPGFGGVQQPGMTGQVKEDILARLGELGVVIEHGRLGFSAALIDRAEFSPHGGRLPSIDVAGVQSWLEFPAGSFALHVCQVPVVVHRGGTAGIICTARDGVRVRQDDGTLTLSPTISRNIFTRTGAITRIDVHLGLRQ